MKNLALSEKFKNKFNFVEPLYRKVKFNNQVRPKRVLFVKCDINKEFKRDGHAFNINKTFYNEGSNGNDKDNSNIKSEYNKVISVSVKKENIKHGFKSHKFTVKKQMRNTDTRSFISHVVKNRRAKSDPNMIGIVGSSRHFSRANKQSDDENSSRDVCDHVMADNWLRVYPAPRLPKETLCSVLFRFIFSQLGLLLILVLWTILWVFVINSFEGPSEKEISEEFARQQNQLVIELATELRQIAPKSRNWRETIEKRIETEREITIMAVGKGAMLTPGGSFWTIPGTVLFTIYVMTALGFGAPVPKTIGGRSSALVYAILAVPFHVFLMYNASTYVVVKFERYVWKWKREHMRRSTMTEEGEQKRDSPSRSSEIIKTTSKCFRKKIIRLLTIFLVGRGFVLAALLYYSVGAVSFGCMRNKSTQDILMFPLEFTTTGGLENIEGYVRILYGLYIEGAMLLLSCALATLRRNSSPALSKMTITYRLYEYE